MTSCSKCGRDIEELGKTGRGICPTCSIVELAPTPIPEPPSRPKRSLSHSIASRNIIAISAIVIVVVIGGVFLALQQPSKSASTSTLTTTVPRPTVATTPAETPITTPTLTITPTSTPAVTEEDRIKEMLRGYNEAFNRHWTEGYVAFFTDDGQKMGNHGKDGFYTGHKSIGDQLGLIFLFYPDIALKNINVTGLEVKADTATVQCKYTAVSEKRQYSEHITEYMELVKVDGMWKISKTDLVT